MTLEERVKNRRIGIVGMARSGVAAAILADHFSGKPFVSDAKVEARLANEIARLKKARIAYETGGHTEKLLDSDYLVVSPGVPLNINILNQARQKGIPIFSELEFAYWACQGKIIAVTGSNGKTTTTTLLGEIFTAAGFDTYVGGNIGLPFSEIVLKIPENGVAVIEVSNFQLETIADFAPDTAVLLNLTPDHLDRHGSFENYKKAKFRITENQTKEHTLVLNLDDPESCASVIKTAAQKCFFSATDSPAASVFVRKGVLYARKDGEEFQIMKCEEILIPGPHNLQNAAAAAAVAIKYDIAPEKLRHVLQSFIGVEHRMEKVGKVAGISFINDSKATNVDSVCYALRSVDTPVYLIAGGRDKGSDFAPIIPLGKGKIKGIVAIGEARDKIFNTFGQVFPVQFAESMEVAVRTAFDMAMPGETVMLSPGCASFDMFDNFEHRGRVFKKAVANLKNGKKKNESVPQV